MMLRPVTAHFVSKTLAATAKAAEAKAAEPIELATAQEPSADLVEEIENMVEVRPNEAVELSSTADVKLMTNGINTSLDFKSKALDPHYVSQPAPSPLEHSQGDHVGAFDVSQFVAGM
ncbi:hypothetical protein ABBQ32_003358 [Trebouxia sp. C0010 RCD-2024]